MPIGRPRWYHFPEPAHAEVSCNGEVHRISWRRGKLVLEDHDLAGEKALLALGGDLSGCLQALSMWVNQFSMAPDHFSQMQASLGTRSDLAPPELALARELGMVINWERAWRASRYLDRQGRFIEKVVGDRALPALRQHLAVAKERFGTRLVRGAKVVAVPGRTTPTLEGRMDRVAATATASLPAHWVPQVWARGAALVGEAFVLEVIEEAQRWEAGVVTRVRAVRWEADHRSPGSAIPVAGDATISRAKPADPWELEWEEGPKS